MTSKLQKSIMRRIWYTYALRQGQVLITAMTFWQGIVFGVALGVFAQSVHIASVFRNLLDTPLGQVPEYIGTTLFVALQTGDIAKVLTLVLLLGIAFSFLKRVAPMSGIIATHRPA